MFSPCTPPAIVIASLLFLLFVRIVISLQKEKEKRETENWNVENTREAKESRIFINVTDIILFPILRMWKAPTDRLDISQIRLAHP